jgi:nitrogen fixation protein FixH
MHAPFEQDGFKLTGRMVFACLVAFFAIVIAVNVVMVRAATSTFGGLETANPYQAGLAFNRDHAAAQAQDGRAWKVTADLVRRSGEVAELNVKLHDRNGNPITDVALVATLAHPADARRDQSVTLVQRAAGEFVGTAGVPRGFWDLIIDASRDGRDMFRSRSRVLLR